MIFTGDERETASRALLSQGVVHFIHLANCSVTAVRSGRKTNVSRLKPVLVKMHFFQKEKNFRCHGIRFNCLCPGAVDTQFLSQIGNAYHAEEHQNRLDTVPRLK
jgi:hypothetical protein